MVVFFLIMIPVTISALDALKIEAISGPATQMLHTILDAIPNVLGALILLAIGYFVGKLAKQAIEQILPSMGFDRAVGALGFTPEGDAVAHRRHGGDDRDHALLRGQGGRAAAVADHRGDAGAAARARRPGAVRRGIILGGVVIARLVSNLVGGAGTAKAGCRRSSNGRSSRCRWRWACASWASPTRS
jgi:hypothetical protein